MNKKGNKMKMIRLKAVMELTGLSGSTINRLEKNGVFPKRKKISSAAVGWFEHEVTEFPKNTANTCNGLKKHKIVQDVCPGLSDLGGK